MNDPSNQDFTDQLLPFYEQKYDFKENIHGNRYQILWYDPCIDSKEKKNDIHYFSQFEEMEKFAKSLKTSFLVIIPMNYGEEKIFQDFRERREIHIRRLLKVEEEFVLKKFCHDILNLLFKVYVFYTLEDVKKESPANDEEIEVTLMKDVKETAKEFREEFVIIWYDENPSEEMKETIIKKLDIEAKNIYKNFGELLKRIKNTKELPFHLIITEKEKNKAKEIMNKEKLLGLYPYDCHKIKIGKTLEDLIQKIQEGIRTTSKLNYNLPAFATNFGAQDRSHIYNLHIFQGLVNFHKRKQAKADFVNLAKTIYESKKIIEFEEEYNDYNKEKILHWYTLDSPLYRVLNNSLRIATSDSILCCRFMLKDLERAIREQYRKKDRKFSGVVYRGAFVSASEWGKLQKNLGKEIEMYGFLSTSTERRAAINFLSNDPQNKFFITIIIPPLFGLDRQGFANVSEFSGFKSENEILFNVRSKFKILEAQDAAKANGFRHLVLLFGAKHLRRFMTQQKPTINFHLENKLRECERCKKTENLFGYKKKNKARVCCLECIQQGLIPIDVPLLVLNNQNHPQELKGKILKFQNKVGFENSGYQCIDCLKTGKKKYCKWINFDRKNEIKQCLDCFKNNDKKEIRGDVLIFESSPFTFWQEEQEEWEVIEADHKEENQKALQYLNEGEVYLQIQNYKMGLEYGKRVLDKLKFKRFKEMEKLKAYDLIAQCLKGLGNNKEALEYLTKRLEIIKFISGEKHPKTARELIKLASCYELLDEFQKALEHSKEALDIYKENLKENPTDSYDRLAMVYLRLGQSKQALEYSLIALDSGKFFYSERHPETASNYNSLALIYGKMGEHQKALQYYQKALDIPRSIYGENHQTVATAYNNLALAHNGLRNFQEAEELHHKAANIWKALGGENHFSLAHSYNNLSTVYGNLQRNEEALDYALSAVEIWRSFYGENHSVIAHCYQNVATIYHFLGEDEKEFEYRLKILEIRISIFEKSHPEIASSLDSLLNVYEEFVDPEKALNLYLRALELWKTVHEGKDLKTAELYKKIIRIYTHERKYFEALEYDKKVLEITKSIHGEMHQDVGSAYSSLGRTYVSLGKYRKSLEYQMKALEIKKCTRQGPLLGLTSLHEISSYMNIAYAHEKLGEYSKAIEYYTKVTNEIPLKGSLVQTDAYRGLFGIYRHLRNYKKALECGQKVLEINKSKYKEDKHPSVAESYCDLGVVYMDLKDYKKAQECFLKGIEIIKKMDYGKTFDSQLEVLENHLKITSNYLLRNVIKSRQAFRKRKCEEAK